MDANALLIRRAGKIHAPAAAGPALAPEYLATFSRNITPLGYALSPDAVAALSALGQEGLARVYASTVAALKELRGVRAFRPMYPNFPAQVMEASEAVLYFNAVFHYFSSVVSDATGGDVPVALPAYLAQPRKALEEATPPTFLGAGDDSDLRAAFRAIASSRTSISEQDVEDLRWLAREGYGELPDEMPHHEVAAHALSAMAICGKLDDGELRKHTHTATDILRFTVALCGGDVSLAEATRFTKLGRASRRRILAAVESLADPLEDMLRWKGRWLRLGEAVHPGEFKAAYPNAYEAFSVLRSGEPVLTFASEVETRIRAGDMAAAALVLGRRPGELARRLDKLIRSSRSADESAQVLSAFRDAADQVSTPVLLQVIAHFDGRGDERKHRVFFPKGSVAKAHAVEWNLLRLDASAAAAVADTAKGALLRRFAQLPPLGPTFVDPELRNYRVPMTRRSASRSLRAVERGSRIPFRGAGDTVRFFLWWKEGPTTSRVDIDLSAAVYNSDWQPVGHISYYNLRDTRFRGAHSGDIVAAPNGACEFVDIDIPCALKHGGRYLAVTINSFTGQHFSDIPECFGGWMLREEPGSGEIFEPSTVEDRVDVASPTRMCIPAVLDLQERRTVWMDVTVKARSSFFGNNLHANLDTVTVLCRSIAESARPDLYTLMSLHAQARGTLVERGSATTLFTAESGLPFDADTIAAEYM